MTDAFGFSRFVLFFETPTFSQYGSSVSATVLTRVSVRSDDACVSASVMTRAVFSITAPSAIHGIRCIGKRGGMQAGFNASPRGR